MSLEGDRGILRTEAEAIRALAQKLREGEAGAEAGLV